jgi:hypothetical protein
LRNQIGRATIWLVILNQSNYRFVVPVEVLDCSVVE